MEQYERNLIIDKIRIKFSFPSEVRKLISDLKNQTVIPMQNFDLKIEKNGKDTEQELRVEIIIKGKQYGLLLFNDQKEYCVFETADLSPYDYMTTDSERNRLSFLSNLNMIVSELSLSFVNFETIILCLDTSDDIMDRVKKEIKEVVQIESDQWEKNTLIKIMHEEYEGTLLPEEFHKHSIIIGEYKEESPMIRILKGNEIESSKRDRIISCNGFWEDDFTRIEIIIPSNIIREILDEYRGIIGDLNPLSMVDLDSIKGELLLRAFDYESEDNTVKIYLPSIEI